MSGLFGSFAVSLALAVTLSQETVALPEGPIKLVDLTGKRLELDKHKLAALGLTKKDVKLPKETHQVRLELPEGVREASAMLDCIVDIEGVPRCRLLKATDDRFGAAALAAATASRYSPLLIRKQPHECAFMKSYAVVPGVP